MLMNEDNYEGTASIIEDDRTLPNAVIFFKTPNKENKFKFRTTSIKFIHPTKDTFHDNWSDIKSEFGPEIEVSQYADIEAEWSREFLSFSWVAQKETTGSGRLIRSKADSPSELPAQIMRWPEFKEHISNHVQPRKQIFRGQNKPWRLRSSFHRSGRADLFRYVWQDIPSLHRRVMYRTKHLFNLEIPDQNGAFYNLVQHHGYPTPLLDWTYSPYVAAFFAYRGISNSEAECAKPEDMVRIHIFEQAQWVETFAPLPPKALSVHLNISVVEFMAIDNDRLLPQQGASMITNVDDVESFIQQRQPKGKVFLRAIDLPVQDRRQAMLELSYMGITAASLFPGLDGACEELAERNFDI